MRATCISGLALAAALGAGAAQGAVITFDTGFSDNEQIDAASFSEFGIRFEGQTDLFIEARGGSDANPQGFLTNETGIADDGLTNADDAQLGGFFLRSAGDVGSRGFTLSDPVLEILYDTVPLGEISGEIWDIDADPSQGNEQWEVRALGAGGSVLATIDSPLGLDTTETDRDPLDTDGDGAANLDGKAWVFSFSDSDILGGSISDVIEIEVFFTGTKTSGIGLAFNNFETGTTEVPLPASGLLLLAGLGGIAVLRRKA